MNRLLGVFLCILIAGCGSVSVAVSDTHLKAVGFSQNAEDAYKRGDYSSALNLYSEALRINRSIENTDGIAINLINMSVIYKKLGDIDNAHMCLDELLSVGHGTYTPLRLAEAGIIKAMLYIDAKKYETAKEWLNKAFIFCEGKCYLEGKIYNLKSRIALLMEDPTSAISYSGKAIELNRKRGDEEEIANSLRFMADARLMMCEYEPSRKLYEEALTIDKKLGLSKKIAIDLIGIGSAFLREGDCKSAVSYFKRTLSVAEAEGDKKGIEGALKMIERCLK